MVILGPPEFAKIKDCVWLPTTTSLPKLMFVGLTVSVPAEPAALNVNTRIIVEKKKNPQNPRRIPLHPEPKFFTARPLVPRLDGAPVRLRNSAAGKMTLRTTRP